MKKQKLKLPIYDALMKAKRRKYKTTPRKAKNKIFIGKHRFYYPDRDYYRVEYLKSDHWKNLKKKKLEEVNHCEVCNATTCLDCHHLDYKHLYDVDTSDLQVLCRRCHHNVHVELKKNPPKLKINTEKERKYFMRCNREISIIKKLG